MVAVAACRWALSCRGLTVVTVCAFLEIAAASHPCCQSPGPDIKEGLGLCREDPGPLL